MAPWWLMTSFSASDIANIKSTKKLNKEWQSVKYCNATNTRASGTTMTWKTASEKTTLEQKQKSPWKPSNTFNTRQRTGTNTGLYIHTLIRLGKTQVLTITTPNRKPAQGTWNHFKIKVQNPGKVTPNHWLKSQMTYVDKNEIVTERNLTHLLFTLTKNSTTKNENIPCFLYKFWLPDQQLKQIHSRRFFTERMQIRVKLENHATGR